jgi:hypothetical protein
VSEYPAKGSFTCLIDHINVATTQVPSARLKYENTVTTIHNNVVHYGIHCIPPVLSLLLLSIFSRPHRRSSQA